MISALSTAIANLEIEHRDFKLAFQAMNARVTEAIAGEIPKAFWLVAPSRVGKSRLINALVRNHLASNVNGVRHVPVLLVEIYSGTSPQALPRLVLDKLGVSIPKGIKTTWALTKYMKEQLELAGTKAILFDEASKLVEASSKVEPNDAAGWFQDVLNIAKVSVFLFGVPRLERLINCDPQIRLRASTPFVWRPYSATEAADMAEYAGCVRSFLAEFEQAGYPCATPLWAIVKNSYLHSAGLIGVLSYHMLELASQVAKHPPRPLDLSDFAEAAAHVASDGHPHMQPFATEDVQDVHLAQTHAHMLDYWDLGHLIQKRSN